MNADSFFSIRSPRRESTSDDSKTAAGFPGFRTEKARRKIRESGKSGARCKIRSPRRKH
jgi:hypothetical protein